MSAKSRRPSRGCRKNQKPAKLDWSEMTMDQREQELLRYLEYLSRQPRTKCHPLDTENIKRAARRGARKAREFLAENPTQEDIQAIWDMHECEMHMLDDSPADFAYHAAYLKTLKRQATTPSLAKEKNARPILTIMADFGMGPLLWLNWTGDNDFGVGGNCCDSVSRCGGHPMSDALFEAFRRWIVELETAPWTEGALINPDDQFSGYIVKPAPILDWTDFHVRGIALAKWLKRDVGAAFRVIYEKSWADPARQDGQRFEALDDGSAVSLPPKPLFRFMRSE